MAKRPVKKTTKRAAKQTLNENYYPNKVPLLTTTLGVVALFVLAFLATQ